MADIAESAGVAPNTIYWYFASKDELLLALLDQANSELLTQIEVLAQEADGLDRLIEHVLSASRKNLALDRTVRQRALASDVVRRWRMRVHERFRNAVATSLKAINPDIPEPELVAEAAISMVEGAFDYETPELSAERIVRHVIPLLARRKECFE